MLLLSIFFLFVLYFLALAFVILLPTELNAALQEKSWIEGAYAADAGLEEALGRLESELAKGLEPSTAALAGTLGDWSYSVQILPDAATQSGGALHTYSLVATASLLGTPKRVLRIKVTQDSFARFAAFSDANPNNTAWMASGTNSGPIHSNSQLIILVPDGYYSTATSPAFLGNITQSIRGDTTAPNGDGLQYLNAYWQQTSNAAPWSGQSASEVADRYAKLYQNGRAAVNVGVKPIDMPSDNGALKKAAWGGNGNPPGIDNKVYVNPDGSKLSGVYVNGDAKIALSVVNQNPTTTIKTSTGTYKVTECRTAGYGGGQVGQTVIEGGSSGPQILSGYPNGAIFAAGNVTSLSGTYQGRYTVAADVANNKNVTITNSLIRSGEAGQSSLGVVGTYVYIGEDAPSTLNIYAAIYAGKKDASGNPVGSFKLAKDSMFTDANPGATLNLYGGQSEAVSGYCSTSGMDGYGNLHRSGYTNGQVVYDATLATSPPPFFPTYAKLRMNYYEEATP